MTGYLKKKLEPIYNKHETEIHQLILKQVEKHFYPAFVDGSWGIIHIDIVKSEDTSPMDIEKKLKQILGSKVMYTHDRTDCFSDREYHCFRLLWRDF